MIARRLQRTILAGLAALSLLSSIAPSFAQPAPVPALPDTERRTSYSITSSTCACSVGFALYGDSTDYANWIEVWLNGVRINFNDATFGWTITSPTGSLSTIPRPITDGVLTFTSAQTGTVQIVGARRPRRTSQFNENTGIPARNVNQVVTDITATLREMWDKTNDMTGRGLFSQPGVTLALLPIPSSCGSKFLGFDPTGLIPQCVTAANPPASVTYAMIQNVAALRLLGNPTGSVAAPSEISLGSSLGFSGSSLNCNPSTASQIGCVKPDGTTTVVSGGVLTAVGAAATSVTAGTTTTAGVTSGNLLGSKNSGCRGTTPCLADSSISAANIPTIPLIAPSSVGAPSSSGSGCNPIASAGAVLHQIPYTDQNWCTNFNLWSMSSVEPSALGTLTVGGTFTTGDVITLNLAETGITSTISVTYTVQPGDTAITVVNGLASAIRANPALFTSPSGGYGSGAMFAYVPVTGTGSLFFDYSSKFQLIWSYTVSGASTETITMPAGWYAGFAFVGGTSTGSANAQIVAGPTGYTGNTGSSITFTAGFTTTGAAFLSVGGVNLPLQEYNSAGVVVNVPAGGVVAGTTYVVDQNALSGTWVLNTNSTPLPASSTKGTFVVMPNEWDATFLVQTSRVNGSDSNGAAFHGSGAAPPGSTLWSLSPAAQSTDCAGNLVYGCVNAGQILLISQGLAHGAVKTGWGIQATSGPIWMFDGDGGLFSYAGGCSYFLQPGCGTHSMGPGSINVSGGVFLNGSAYTNPDYVLENFYTGKIEKFANSPGAKDYTGMLGWDDLESYIKKYWELPGIPEPGVVQDKRRPVDMFERGDILLRNVEELTLRDIELNKRLREAEASIADLKRSQLTCIADWKCRLFGWR
jgi:hypothetical protein